MRCVNCQLRIARLRRHRLSDESKQIVERVQRWVHPREITGDDYICHSCWELINNNPNENPEPKLGHRNVCAGCGKSILRIRSRLVLRPNMSERETLIGNIVLEWIRPRQLTLNDEICVPCYLRAQRVVDSSLRSPAVAPSTISQPTSSQQIEQAVKDEEVGPSTSGDPLEVTFSVKVEEVGPSTSENPLEVTTSVKVEEVGPSTSGDPLEVASAVKVEEVGPSTSGDPLEVPSAVKVEEVVPSTSGNPLEETSAEQILPKRRAADTVEGEEVSPSTLEQPLQETSKQIMLPTMRRAADTARRCLFSECNNTEKRHVPDGLRKQIIKDFNFYIPKNARICNFHLGSNLFYGLYAAENAISTFSAVHIEEIVFLLSDNRKLDFQNPENIDDHLFKYWFGRTKVEYNEMLIEKPRLNNPKIKIGYCALLCKMRTGDSNESISELFQMPRRTLEDYMKQAREILCLDI